MHICYRFHDGLNHGFANHATEEETLQSPIHCCDVTKPPYLFSGEVCTSSLHCKRFFVYTVCCRRAVSASLCSEHVNQTSYWRSGRQYWDKLRHRAVTQCATLAHPWFIRCLALSCRVYKLSINLTVCLIVNAVGEGSTNYAPPPLCYILPNHGRLARWIKWRACDVGEAKERLKNEAPSPNFPSLHLCQNSFSNPSVALPTSQLILQSFRCFTYVTVHSPTFLLLLLRHKLFT